MKKRKNKIISCGIVLALIVLMISIVHIESKAAYDAYLAKQHKQSVKFAQEQMENMTARAEANRKEFQAAVAKKEAEEEAARIAAEEEAKRLAEEQAALAAQQKKAVQYNSTQYAAAASSTDSTGYTDPSGLRQAGVLHNNGSKWTWYTQRILPGQGLNIPGRHLDENGLVCDGDGNVVLASSTSNRGQVVDTPFGKQGKVYDAGNGGSSWYDVYTDW